MHRWTQGQRMRPPSARGGGRGSDAFGGSDEALAAYITELLSTPDDLSDMVRVAKPAAAKKGAQKAKGRKAGKRGNPTKPPRAGAALPAPCMPVEAFLEQQYSISWGVARLDVNAKRAFTIFTDARRHAAAWVKAHPKKAGTVCGLVPLMVKASATANAIVLAHRKRGGPLPAGVLSPMSAADKKRMARAVAVPLGKPLPKGLLPAVVPLA
eukprot:TRINITY_DN188_c0_g1_i4.p2 TRINITY_DN188_c0_g1~~TRINITY_DN188_c0_g1_i4.p2  ORF type:complete len:211 (+),score=67.38 TRINITY_DN188_c0_g1_i4:357-989(+)